MVSLVTQLLGKQTVLSAGDIEKLLATRAHHAGNASESNRQTHTPSNSDLPPLKPARRSK